MNHAAHYHRLLSRRSSDSGLESTEAAASLDLTADAIDERTKTAGDQLHRVVRDHLGDDAALHTIADRMVAQGGEALRRLGSGQAIENHPESLSGLEAIVQTDGSRPSFLIRNGEVDLTTSPVGDWADTLTVSAELLADAIACVGRIDLPGAVGGFQGTGFLVHENLILTNRHVLQVVADPDGHGGWKFRPGVSVDFGHEFRGGDSIDRRPLKTVIFTGPKVIKSTGPVEHTRLDVALIEIGPSQAATPSRPVLAVDGGADWTLPDQAIFTIGYPADPGDLYPPTLLEQLFRSTFGCKRLAPGLIMKPSTERPAWTLTHDATTLGGNSGSVVLVTGREQIAAGLHYGGRRGEPRENWGHILASVLDGPGMAAGSPGTLRKAFETFGVIVIDRPHADDH